jgi:hypothetical protein
MHEDRAQYFWQRVEKTDHCWNWSGSVSYWGYGVLNIPGHKWLKRAHRVSWEMENGEIPPGLIICHTCDNPLCVKPAHLFLGTNKQNTQDMLSKNRQKKPFLSHTDSDLLEMKRLFDLGKTLIEVGAIYGISQSQACRIRQHMKRISTTNQ